MRPTVLIAAFVLAVAPGPDHERRPPYDHAAGAADARTGTIGSGMARTGGVGQAGLPPVAAGTIGLVGIDVDLPAGRVRARASVDVAHLAALDPAAALCIRISAPATGDAAALPNIREGGGPVCRFLDAHGSVGWEQLSGFHIETFADLEVPRAASADVFLSWRQPHPREWGATAGVARVLSISAGAA